MIISLASDLKFYEPCITGAIFPKEGENGQLKVLELVHSDVCGKLELNIFNGGEYFVTLMTFQDMSRYLY